MNTIEIYFPKTMTKKAKFEWMKIRYRDNIFLDGFKWPKKGPWLFVWF